MIKEQQIIRMATADDAVLVAAIYDQTVSRSAASFEYITPNASEIARRINETVRVLPWLVFQSGESVAGYAYAVGHRNRQAYQWSVETSVYVDAGRHRRGVGRALYNSLLAVLTIQGFYQALAGIALPNPASEALHRTCGFEPAGVFRNIGFKLGGWRDVAWWQRSLRDPPVQPAPPSDLRTLCNCGEFRAALSKGLC